jgi:hypothetical protein
MRWSLALLFVALSVAPSVVVYNRILLPAVAYEHAGDPWCRHTAPKALCKPMRWTIDRDPLCLFAPNDAAECPMAEYDPLGILTPEEPERRRSTALPDG